MPFLLITEHGDVTEIQLHRPPVNALNATLLRELKQAFETAVSNGAKGILLSGSSGLFSAGMDLKDLQLGGKVTAADMGEAMSAVMKMLAMSPIPIASAITGHAVAGGLVLNLFSDYRIMATGDFQIGLNEAKLSIPFTIPDLPIFALQEIVGLRYARIMVNEGLLLSANQALEMGLVDQVAALQNVKTTALARLKTVVDLQTESNLSMRLRLRQNLIEAANL